MIIIIFAYTVAFPLCCTREFHSLAWSSLLALLTVIAVVLTIVIRWVVSNQALVVTEMANFDHNSALTFPYKYIMVNFVITLINVHLYLCVLCSP